MANTLTALIPAMTTAILPVLNERAPLPAICMADFKTDEAALNESVTIPTAPAVAGTNRTSAAIFTQAADRAIVSTTISLTKDRSFPFYMTGDDYARARQNQDYVPASFKEALRALRNEIQSDLAGQHVNAAGYYSATTPSSGAAFGTAGTAPFGSDISAATAAEKFLNDSLAPSGDRYLMIDTAAKQNLGQLGSLIKANEAGSDQTLRRGIIGDIAGFNVVWANDVKLWTPVGTGTSYVVNGTNAAGSTNLVVKTGSGTILAGDVITVTSGGVATKYVVGTGIAAAGTLVLTSGLVQAAADGDVVAVNAASRRNLALHRSALGLAVRIPKMPPGGTDMAIESQVIRDPDSGFPVRVAHYMGYGMDQWEIQAVWGVKTVRPSLMKLILG